MTTDLDLVLAIDTAGPTTVAGLARHGEILARFTHTDPLRHGEVLVPGIAAMFADAGLDRSALTSVVVGVGPGPYTGLRVGIATAIGLGAALGIQVEGVCSLDVVSLGLDPAVFEAVREGRLPDAPEGVLVTSDARRRELYWARFVAPGVRTRQPGGHEAGRARHRGPGRRPGPGPVPHRVPEPGPTGRARRRPVRGRREPGRASSAGTSGRSTSVVRTRSCPLRASPP